VPNCSAIILAGGDARRFQEQNLPWQDKAVAEINKKPLLVYVIEKLSTVVDQIIVSVNDANRQAKHSKVIEKYDFNVKFIIDRKDCKIRGPVLALMSSLDAIQSNFCLIVPVDMPFLKPEVASYMLDSVEGVDVAVPIWPNSTVETLLMALNHKTGLELARTLCFLGESRTDSIIRGAGKLLLLSPLDKIASLDPKFESFVNINSKDNLRTLETRSLEGEINTDITFNRNMALYPFLHQLRVGQKNQNEGKFSEALNVFSACGKSFEEIQCYFWAGLSFYLHAKAAINQPSVYRKSLMRAAKNYRLEAQTYQQERCWLLAKRAQDDAFLCKTKAFS
jgi:molybdopterin-guanine dinucleotide biosynthesis protein A